MSYKKILICGFSGSGKTSFLREIEFSAPNSDWIFSDLDTLILKEKKYPSIEDLVEKEGWEKFRLWERQVLEGWLKEEGNGIISLGGGTLTPLLLQLLKPIRKVGLCYIHAPFADAWERLHLPDTEPRPLIKLGQIELQKIYEERQRVFSEVSWRVENPKGTDLQKLALKFWQRVLPS